MAKKTYVSKVLEELETLKVNKSFSKKEFITKHWGDHDFFLDRSFSVAFVNAKKQIPSKIFRTIRGKITRIK